MRWQALVLGMTLGCAQEAPPSPPPLTPERQKKVDEFFALLEKTRPQIPPPPPNTCFTSGASERCRIHIEQVVGGKTVSCTGSGTRTCGDGVWGECRGTCIGSAVHEAHPNHCATSCSAYVKCSTYNGQDCKVDHHSGPPKGTCCPGESRPCQVTCSILGSGSCTIVSSQWCLGGQWGSCSGQCSFSSPVYGTWDWMSYTCRN